MKSSRFSEEGIIGILKAHQAGHDPRVDRRVSKRSPDTHLRRRSKALSSQRQRFWISSLAHSVKAGRLSDELVDAVSDLPRRGVGRLQVRGRLACCAHQSTHGNASANGLVESLDLRMRDEYLFGNLSHARNLVAAWRIDFNHRIPAALVSDQPINGRSKLEQSDPKIPDSQGRRS